MEVGGQGMAEVEAYRWGSGMEIGRGGHDGSREKMKMD